MHSHKQYLDTPREEHRGANHTWKDRLLNGAPKRTRLNRMVLICKTVASVYTARATPPRPVTYGAELVSALEVLEYPCGRGRCSRGLREHR